MAMGGVDYYTTHEWNDNAMVVYEFPTPSGVVRAFYQVQTTTSAGGGYFEYFMGDEGSLKISENPRLTAIYKEVNPQVSWDGLIRKNWLRAAPVPAVEVPEDGAKVDSRESPALAQYEIPIVLGKDKTGATKAIHQPHLENFFNAIRGTAKLNCPADEAFASEYIIFKANEALTARKTIDISAAEFEV